MKDSYLTNLLVSYTANTLRRTNARPGLRTATLPLLPHRDASSQASKRRVYRLCLRTVRYHGRFPGSSRNQHRGEILDRSPRRWAV